MTGDDAAASHPAAWRDALAIAVGRSDGADPRAFAVAGVVCLSVVPLATFHSLIASSGGTVLSAGMCALCLAVVAFCMVALVTAHRRPDDDGEPAETGPVAAAAGRHWLVALWGLAALVYGVEALSAFSALFLESTEGLWSARTFFLWHVADTLPVLAVTDTFVPRKPTLALGAAGFLALALKVALILPLFRIAVAAFRVFDGSGGTADREGFRVFTPNGPRTRSDLPLWRSAVRAIVVVTASGGALTVMLTVCNWVGPLSERVASVLPRTTARWVRAVGARVLDVLGSLFVQSVVLAVLSVVLILSTWLIVRGLLRADLGVLSRVTVGLAVLFASLMSLLLVFSTAVAVDLLLTSLLEGRPPMVEAAGRLEWFAWHSMDVVPEWTVPGVLDWPKPTGPSSWWSGVLLMLAKLIAVLVIAVPVARVARAARRTWPDHITRITGSR